MDYLSQYADFLKKRSPASEPIPEGVIGKLMLAQNAAPKLETDMALPGADIVFKSPSDAPPAQVQDMPVAEISAEAPREIESKYKMLNRILGIGDNMLEKAKMPEDQQRSVIESFQAVKQAANRPQRKLDLSDIQARMGSADGQKGGEWDTSDYIKAALVATLPALAGGLAGGLAGAAGGAPAGVKGIDLAIKQSEDKKKSKTDALSKEADMRIKQFNAESQDSGRQIKTMADLVKLEVDTYGKIQEPTKKLLEKFLPAYAAGEIDTYERELQEKGLLERKGLEEETQGQVENEKIASKEREGAASRKFKAGENQSDRDFKAEQADLDRQLREKLAKQAAKAKVSAGAKAKPEKPPTESQTKNAYYYNRAVDADKIAEQLWQTPDFDASDWPDLIRGLVPGKLRPFVSNIDAQRYDQAKEDFVTAILRPESGAVIGDEERKREEAKYFPVPGDIAETVEQKRRAREAALAGLKAAAGESAQQRANEGKKLSRKLDPKVVQVATESGISYGQARQALINRGYVPVEEETTERKK